MEIERPSDQHRLRESVRKEVEAQNALMGLNLDSETVDNLAWAVSSTIEYGFNVEWSPKWVKARDPHHWQEPNENSPSGEWHLRECLECGRTTRHATTEEADADYRAHESFVLTIREETGNCLFRPRPTDQDSGFRVG